MAQITWPDERDWMPQRFQLRVMANERLFEGYYSGQSQAEDLQGEHWVCELELPARRNLGLGRTREVVFEKLRRANTVLLWNMRTPTALGTISGTPTLRTSATQLSPTINIQTTAGKTLLAGSMIGFGGQVSRVMGDATANGSGQMDNVEVWPRVRTALSSGISITLSKPLIEFRVADAGGVPVVWAPASITDSIALRLIEA